MNKSARELPMRLCSLAAAKRTIQLLSSSLNGPRSGAVSSCEVRNPIDPHPDLAKRFSPTALINSMRSIMPCFGLLAIDRLNAFSKEVKFNES
jgi:hypothetical protein